MVDLNGLKTEIETRSYFVSTLVSIRCCFENQIISSQALELCINEASTHPAKPAGQMHL